MNSVIVIGGGRAGCSAAVTARKVGANVTLPERTDMLPGLGNVGGEFFERMKKNGLYTTEKSTIIKRVKELELYDMYNIKIV